MSRKRKPKELKFSHCTDRPLTILQTLFILKTRYLKIKTILVSKFQIEMNKIKAVHEDKELNKLGWLNNLGKVTIWSIAMCKADSSQDWKRIMKLSKYLMRK